MCFVWIWEQTAIISLYNINWLVFITETECVYCAVRTGSLTAIPVDCTRQTTTVISPKTSFNLLMTSLFPSHDSLNSTLAPAVAVDPPRPQKLSCCIKLSSEAGNKDMTSGGWRREGLRKDRRGNINFFPVQPRRHVTQSPLAVPSLLSLTLTSLDLPAVLWLLLCVSVWM